MEITRDVILDLMPLYVAGEVSEDTRRLVEAFLEKDKGLANLAESTAAANLKDVPINFSKEQAMEAFEKANKMRVIRTLGLAAIIATTLLALLLIVPLIYMFVF
ncbi:MAG: zf-HC2 domain-containing protein [Anaerolineales bacterium]|nr:MAG: zf-HC2 domain-containing protein [Anaerolineales bacterium]